MTEDVHVDQSPPAPDQVRRIGLDGEALERVYRAHVGDVVAYLSRRCPDPHTVADLAADTFVLAIDSAGRFDPKRGRPVAWLIGIARHVYLRHVRGTANERRAVGRLEGRRLLDDADILRLEERIDAERRAQGLLGNLDALTERERELVDLVDLAGLTASEAAAALRISVVVAAVVVPSIGGDGPAASAAVTKNADGTVTVNWKDLDDTEAANKRLRELRCQQCRARRAVRTGPVRAARPARCPLPRPDGLAVDVVDNDSPRTVIRLDLIPQGGTVVLSGKTMWQQGSTHRAAPYGHTVYPSQERYCEELPTMQR